MNSQVQCRGCNIMLMYPQVRLLVRTFQWKPLTDSDVLMRECSQTLLPSPSAS